MSDKQKETNAIMAVKDVIESELQDYLELSIKIEECDIYDDDAYISVEVLDADRVLQYMKFKIENITDKASFNPEEDNFNIYVEISEDSYERIKTYDWQVKYFWIAFMDWPRPYKKV